MKEIASDRSGDPASRPGLTRRKLVAIGGTAAAGTALGGLRQAGGASAVPRGRRRRALRRSAWAGLEGTAFRVGAKRHRLVLTAVDDLPPAAGIRALRGSEDAFSLRFEGPAANPLAGGTRTLRNRRWGRTRLFISPVGEPGRTQVYEVVVNRVGA